MTGFPADWSPYHFLELEARMPGLSEGDSMRICVRLDDYFGKVDGVWVSRCLWVTSQWRSFTVDLRRMRIKGTERAFRWILPNTSSPASAPTICPRCARWFQKRGREKKCMLSIWYLKRVH